jgi:enoyl-CoA hydratase/carnithine racemase
MSASVPLRVESRGEIAELVIDRPDKRNAMSYEMWAALPAVAAEIDADDSLKVLVVRGAGSNFCAGADISEFAERRGTPEAARDYGQQVEAAAHALSNMRKPSIAMIHGYCIGGGCELALACDLRFADTTARFAITPSKLGIVYSFDSTRRLASVTSPSFAKLLLFSANQVDAEHARRVGLIDHLIEPEELDKITYEFAETVAGRSQVSVRGAKRLIEKAMSGLDATDEEAAALSLEAVTSEDYREGVAAFLAKRAPQFGLR